MSHSSARKNLFNEKLIRVLYHRIVKTCHCDLIIPVFEQSKFKML